MMMVRKRSGSFSASRAKKRRLSDDEEMVSAEKDGVFENQEREQHIPVEAEGNMDEDEDEDEEELEDQDEGREDSSLVYLVGDDVWETKAFSMWREMNWALFNYNMDEHTFFQLPKEAFKPEKDPRSRRRWGQLKMGHTFMHIDHPESIRSFDPNSPGTLAILFYNRENEMGKTMKFESVLSASIGTRRDEPSGTVYFFTILATETDSGVQKEFQASFFKADDGNKKLWYLRALREKPFVF